jgi:FlaA1/EpsC-like NDP-sugar epimerase
MANKLFKYIFFSRWTAFVHDLFWIPLSLYCAYLLRFNLEGIPQQYFSSLLLLVAIAIPVQGVVFWFFGLYRGLWRFASVPDLVRILKAVLVGALLLAVIIAFSTHLIGIPRTVFILYPIFLVVGLSIPRMVYRWYKDHRIHFVSREGTKVLIIGAGQAGELLLRDILHKQEVIPVAFVDDDVSKHGREIHGIRVLGGLDGLGQIVKSLDVDELLIAVPSATKPQMQHITEQCSKVNIPSRILPPLFELSGKDVDFNQLRAVTVDDLLGRDPVELDTEAISFYLHNKVVLVTGGGGSIGSELCRQVAGMQPKSLIVFEHGEFNLYAIDNELRADRPELNLVTVLGDVKNRERVDWVLKTYKPDVVFHAAAYKHVPLLEKNPAEGVQNNIIGTRILVDAVDRFGVERFVLISTDKAVNPANVMGTTKRIAEIYCQNFDARSRTRFITTRFGNVLGSAGSVVPLFEKQIQNGGPVTVTHPEICRYFMTISEAVSLILQAGSMGKGGEIFVLDMGEPVLIQNLAEQMIRLSGFEPGRDIEITYTGLRPGEKLFEEIFHESEGLQPTSHTKLLLARSRQVDWQWIEEELSLLQEAAISRNVDGLKTHLRNIVPEFQG